MKHQGAFNRSVDVLLAVVMMAGLVTVGVVAAAAAVKGGQQLYSQLQKDCGQ